jgi:outer membrane protein assembly factor BamB
MGKILFFVLGAFLFLGCSTSTGKKKSRWQAAELARSWSRSTVDESYIGIRQPAVVHPLVQKDRVLVGNSIDGLISFNAKTGHQQWKLELKNGLEGVSIDDQQGVYFGANNGQFYHLNGETGSIVWSFPLGSESVSSPLIQGNFIYHMTMNGSLFCLEKETGRVLWVKSRPPKDSVTVRGTTSPVFFDGKVGVGYSDGYFVAYTAVDGSLAWEKQLGDSKKFNDVDATPVVTDKCLLASNVSESLFCLDKANGSILWRLDEGGSSQPVAVADGTVYFSLENALLKIDLASGKIKKRFDIDKKWGILSGAIPYKNWLLFGLSEGPLVLMDRESGQWVDTFYPGRGVSIAPQVVAETGDVYLLSNQANIYKMKVLPKKARAGRRSVWKL